MQVERRSRWSGLVVVSTALAVASCAAGRPPSRMSETARPPAAGRTALTVRLPDAFYDPPAHPSRTPGTLLRSEPLQDVTLPAGMRGWRILYATTVDDRTPATAVATVFAPTSPPPGPRPVITLANAFEGCALATATNAQLAARLTQNTARGRIVAPVVIAQGRADVVVPPAATDAYVDERCADGQRLAYWSVAGADHATIVRSDSPLEAPLVAWTAARFAHERLPKGCTRRAL